MKEDTLKKLKAIINNERLARKLKEFEIEEARKLEKSEQVKRYLVLCGIAPATKLLKIPSEESVDIEVFNFFLSKIKPDETNKIFVYAGTYSYGEKGMVRVKANSVDCEYRKYFDIEQLEPFFLPIEECEKFEKENTILVASVDDVRKCFLRETLKSNQEQASILVKSKYKTKI